MKNYKAKDVDEYIASAGMEAQPTLKEIRKIIKSAVPKAEESISWGVPFYKHLGLLAGFAAFKSHVGFGFADALATKDRAALEKKGYSTGKKTVQIRFNQPVPAPAIKRILNAKARANEEKKTKK